jgi:hypothetical protein
MNRSAIAHPIPRGQIPELDRVRDELTLKNSGGLYPMNIVSRQKIREAVARALLLDCEAGAGGAIEAVAAAYGLPGEVVRGALEPAEESAS